jgi:hypothetical protein
LSTTASRTGPLGPGQYGPRRRGVGGGVATDQLTDVGAFEPEGRGVELEPVHGAGLHPPDGARGRGGQLVESVVAVHHEHAGTAGGIHAGHHLGQIVECAADQAGPRHRRVGERPEQIEDRGHADLPADHGGVPVRRMELRREGEADAHLGDAAGHLLGSQIDPHPERLEGVGST